MKKIALYSLVVLGVVGVLLALPYLWISVSERLSHRQHAQLIERAFNDRLLPASAFVRGFVGRENRLPSGSEVDVINHGKSGWGVVTIIREQPPWLDSWGVVGKDFIVRTSEPEWNLYYCSWNNKRIEYWTD